MSIDQLNLLHLLIVSYISTYEDREPPSEQGEVQ